MRFKKYFKNQQGFSMIDLIVSASIVAILSAMVIANYRGSNQKIILDSEAERLSSIIRQANINALIGQTVNGVRPPGGFGVHIEKCAHSSPAVCSYSLFADQDQDYKLSAADDILQTINTFDKNVEFNNISAGSNSDIAQLDVTFVPPQGTMYFFDENGVLSDEEVTITLHFIKTSYQKFLIINRTSGRLDIQ